MAEDTQAGLMEERIVGLILKLEALKQDAKKFDGGRTGDPGTRLRKALLALREDMNAVRKEIVAARGEE